MSSRMSDAGPRAPAARSGRRRPPQRPAVGPDRRAGPRARRRWRDRHPVPALGGRLLLQRRRDRRSATAASPAGGCASRAPSTGARSTRSTASRRSPSPSAASRCPCATTASPAASSRSASQSSSMASWSTARSKATASRSSTPTSTRPRTPNASTQRRRGVRRVLAASLNGALGRAGLMLDAGRRDVRRDGHGLRHPPRRPPDPPHGADATPGCASVAPRWPSSMMQRALITRDFSLAVRAAGRVAQHAARSTTSPPCGRRSRARSCCGS